MNVNENTPARRLRTPAANPTGTVARVAARPRGVHATNVRTVARPVAARMPVQTRSQRAVPQRSRAITPIVLGVVAVGTAGAVAGLVWVVMNYGLVLLGFATVVALVMLGLGGRAAANHCPGPFHR